MLFLAKKTSIFEKTVRFVQGKNDVGLTYDGNATIVDLIGNDTDGDGIPDWQEPLFGLDPTKKETTPGIPDSTAIAKMRTSDGDSATIADGTAEGTENLTETDKFSRELFSTTATLSQTGEIDQATADKISSSLAEKIKNYVPRKIYTLSDIKIINDNSLQAIKKYDNALKTINKKYQDKESVFAILQKFIVNENNVDSSVLTELDPVITQSQTVMSELIKISVPQSLAPLLLDSLNASERLIENMSDIKLFDTDPIVAMSAISKYKDNINLFNSALFTLTDTISKKLNN